MFTTILHVTRPLCGLDNELHVTKEEKGEGNRSGWGAGVDMSTRFDSSQLGPTTGPDLALFLALESSTIICIYVPPTCASSI